MGLGKEKRIISCGIFLFFFITVNGQISKKVLLNSDSSHITDYIVNADGSVIINYHLSELTFGTVVNEHGSFYRISVPGHVTTAVPGKPELPVYSNLIMLPENREYKIKISEVKSERVRPAGRKIDGILFPAQESLAKTIQQEKPVFRIDKDAYSLKGLIKNDTVSVEFLGKARNTNLGNLIISPVRYNPKSNALDVITSMKIEVVFTEPVNMAAAGTSHFSKSVMKGVLNFSTEVVPDYTDKPAGLIILSDTSFRKQLNPLIRWKTQKGFRVKTLYKGAIFAGNTLAELKDTIARIYNSATEEEPAPDYLLIVGDVNRIPCFGTGSTSNYTDMYYGEFTGSGDYVPEMYVGRLPVQDTAEARSVVNKIIQYEKFQFAETNKFYRNALATTGYDAAYSIYMNGQARYLVNNYLTPANNIDETHFYHYTGSDPETYLQKQKDSIIKVINKGVSFINYSGHGDESGWLHLNIKSADTALLKNMNMYPVIISNACRTAAFNASNSFGNSLVLGGKNGAAGFIGCSNDSYWNEDYYWTVGVGAITDNPTYSGKGLGIFDRFFHTHNESPSDWYYTLGQINYAGNLAVSSSTSFRKKYYWETYNVVGDPSMIPLLGEPKPFNVSLPDTLPNGIRSLTLTVEPFSYIAVSHFDTLWDASFGGISGGVTLKMPGLSNDSCLIVITGQNRYPVIKTVYFADMEGEFLNLNNAEINDPSGNNNKKADFREQLYLSVNISNLGLANASGVYVKISTSSEWLTIQKDSAYIGTIQSRSNVVIPDKLLIDIAEDVPDMGLATVELLVKSEVSEKRYPVQIIVHSPELLISNLVIDDTGTGNGDRIPDPGETLTLVFSIRNDGSSDATGHFNISSPNGGITIIEQGVTDKILKSGQITDIPLKVQLSESLSSGSYINLATSLDSDPFMIQKNFTFRIGKMRESFESMSFNIFPWINKSPVPWTVTRGNFYEGAVSARSGVITDNGTSSLIIKCWYGSSDTLKFWYKVSSEQNYDHLFFFLNGKEILKKSGETGWIKASVPVKEGLNVMEWTYKKDNSQKDGSDCAWIDMIDFANAGPVRYIYKDLHVARIVTPIVKNHIGQGLLRVKLLNTGKDTINGFNLAFATDDASPVKQHFDKIITPGSDSLEITFKSRVDLSRYGKHNLVVYGYDNGDDFAGNDTTGVVIENTTIEEAIVVYPNPVINDFTLFVNSNEDDRIRITFANSAGAVIYSTDRAITVGGNDILLNCEHLAPTVYYLNIRGSTINKTLPFIKIK